MYMCVFDILVPSYIIMCVNKMLYIFLCRRNPSAVSLSIPCAYAQGDEPMFVRIDVQSLSMPFMSAIGR